MTIRKSQPPKAAPEPPEQQNLPALSDPSAEIELPPDLEFTPVPRKTRRADGLTPEIQRRFIAAIVATGSVKGAARMIGIPHQSLYSLRYAEGSDEFRAAWVKAVARGAGRVLDTVMDHSINGVPETLFGPDGTKVAERRRFSTRAQMWILAHHFPERFGVSGGLTQPGRGKGPGKWYSTAALKKLRAKWKAKWIRQLRKRIDAYEAAESASKPWAHPPDSEEKKHFLDEGLRLYRIKVEQERVARLSGRIVSADFTMRQLTHIELMLETGGAGFDLIDQTGSAAWKGFPDDNRYQSDLTRRIDETRRAAWAELGEPERPATPDYAKGLPPRHLWGGPTVMERGKAQREAQEMAAQAQALWEAAANEESWERWKGDGFPYVEGEG